MLPEDFDPASRVWIYQCNRLLGITEVLEADAVLQDFVAQWNSHGSPVKGFASVFFGQFIIIMADESHTGVGGCSTDSSVRLIKLIEEKFRVNLFDRQLLAFVVKEKIQLLPLAQLKHAVENGFIDRNTPYFNNTVATKAELEEKWIIPISESWLASRLNLAAQPTQ